MLRLLCVLGLAMGLAAEGVAPMSTSGKGARRRTALSTTSSTTAPTGATTTVTGSAASRANAYRYKLSQHACPTAEDSEKALLACKNYEISHKIKGAGEEQKKVLGEERKKLYSEAAAKPTEVKKAAGVAHKVFFAKAFAKYCAEKPASDVCANETMKKMYGAGGEKRKRVKKA